MSKKASLNTNAIFPPKLKRGDGVRIVAPARSLAMPWLNDELKKTSRQRLEDLGLKLSFGPHVNEIDPFDSSSIESRVADFHEAFADPSIHFVLTVIGGYNSNQLLSHLDYDLIKANPKIFCGYSDITALSNAIHARTGLVTYSGPHFHTFGSARKFDYLIDNFKKCLFAGEPWEIQPAAQWSDRVWVEDETRREEFKNDGFWIMTEGHAAGKIVGGNLCTFNVLQGTEYMPGLKDTVLFVEDDNESLPHTFDRDLQSLIHQPAFEGVKGLVIGRFQSGSKMTRELLTRIVRSKKELGRIPVIANVDFGHTMPMITFPIGGNAAIQADGRIATVEIVKH